MEILKCTPICCAMPDPSRLPQHLRIIKNLMRTHLLILTAALCCLALTVRAQAPAVTGVTNYYSTVEGTVAPGMIAMVEGSNLASSSVSPCGSLTTGAPTNCGGVSITFGGKAAAIGSVSPTQLVVVIPIDVTGISAEVVLTNSSGQSKPYGVQVRVTDPSLAPTNSATEPPIGDFFDQFNNQVTPANAVLPGATVHIQADGFGVTNPVVPTGAPVPQSPLPVVVAPVQVLVNGVNATVVSATLSPNTANPFDLVTFVVPQVSAGIQLVTITVGGVQSLAVGLVVAPEGTRITSAANSASNAIAPFPNAGVTPGSIIVVYGNSIGPSQLLTAPGYPWPKNLGGTMATVTAGSQSYQLLLYYTSATQIAGLLPSAVPPGNANLLVTYNGQISNALPITVIANNFGTYTVAQNGSGAGIVTFGDYSLVTPTHSANPGETLIIWGTGLGAVSGDEADGPLPGDMPNLPVQVWVGGISAQVTYRGRSGCCVGEDQIVFVVPNGPSVNGCNVPLAVQINNEISNYSTVAIASSGGACTPAFSVYPYRASSPASPRTAYIEMTRTLWPQPPVAGSQPNVDSASATFAVLGQTLSQFDLANEGPSFGSCMVYPGNPPTVNPPVASGLDAGSSLSIQGPSGSRTLAQGVSGLYTGQLGDSSPGNYLDPGGYELTGPGGADVGAFTAPFTIPQFTWTNQPSSLFPRTGYARATGLTITWSGGDPNGYVQVIGTSFSTQPITPSFVCQARATDGSLTVPPSVMLALLSDPANLTVAHFTSPAPFTAPGLDEAVVLFEWLSTAYVTFN